MASGKWRSLRRRKSCSASDIYCITDRENGFSVCIEFSESRLNGFHSISFIDHRRKEAVSARCSSHVRMQSPEMPISPFIESGISYASSSMTMAAVRKDSRRLLLITAPYLQLPSGEVGFKCDAELQEEEWGHTADDGCTGFIAIAPMYAEGIIFIGDRIRGLDCGSTGMMLWSRKEGSPSGIYAAASSAEGGKATGIILSDSSPSSILSEDCRIEGGMCRFTCPADKLSHPWRIEDETRRIRMEMEPLCLNGENEVWGIFRGTAEKDDGSGLEIAEAYGMARIGS